MSASGDRRTIHFHFHPDTDLKGVPLVDCGVLPIRENQRPLRGISGYVDWHLLGMISQILLASHMSGAKGERLLIPPQRMMAAQKLLLVGRGRSGESRPSELPEELASLVSAMFAMGGMSQLWPLFDIAEEACDPAFAVECLAGAIEALAPVGAVEVWIVGGGAWTRSAREAYSANRPAGGDALEWRGGTLT